MKHCGHKLYIQYYMTVASLVLGLGVLSCAVSILTWLEVRKLGQQQAQLLAVQNDPGPEVSPYDE